MENIKDHILNLEEKIVSNKPHEAFTISRVLTQVDYNSEDYFTLLREIPRLCAVAINTHKKNTSVMKKWFSTLVQLGIDICGTPHMGDYLLSVYYVTISNIKNPDIAYDLSNTIMDSLSTRISDHDTQNEILQKVAKGLFFTSSSSQAQEEVKEKLIAPVISEITIVNETILDQISALGSIFEDAWKDRSQLDERIAFFKKIVANRLVSAAALLVSFFKMFNPDNLSYLSAGISDLQSKERVEVIEQAFSALRDSINTQNIQALIPIINFVEEKEILLAKLTARILTEKPSLIQPLIALVDTLAKDLTKYMFELVLELLHKVSYPTLFVILYSELPPMFQESIINAVVQVSITVEKSSMQKNEKKGIIRMLGSGLLKALGNEYIPFIETVKKFLEEKGCENIVKEWKSLSQEML
ncbi:MAG: hypothetical protein QXL15_02345 [Candidatus Korarchaeota archaeon]